MWRLTMLATHFQFHTLHTHHQLLFQLSSSFTHTHTHINLCLGVLWGIPKSSSAFSSESPKSDRRRSIMSLTCFVCVICTMRIVASVQISLWKIKLHSTLMHSVVWHCEEWHCAFVNCVNPVEIQNWMSVVVSALHVLWKDNLVSSVSLQLIEKLENKEVMTSIR